MARKNTNNTMIKAFENFEVWFVTGAQLLYGGDAVVQVDGHSNEMVAGMNASGILPVRLAPLSAFQAVSSFG